MSRKIEVQILGDAKSLEAALSGASRKTGTFGKAVNEGAKVGAAGFLALGLAAKVGIDELVDSQKVAAQTAAVIKSTGGAANVTAGHIHALSQELLQLSGVDDETIAAGENVLLTFRNIQNQTGKNNDVFDQATKATLDLSVAMGEDMHSAAIQVGKALNDPVKGLTALKRVGVQFTDAQTEMIKKLVETGHTVEAQKIILGELNKEFGGSAAAAGKTLPGQLSKLKESFADVSAELVGDLIPAFQALAGIMQVSIDFMKRHHTTAQILIGALAGISAALIAAKIAMTIYNSSLLKLIRMVRIATVVEGVWTGVQWALNAAMEANPVVLITTAIIALGIAIVIAYKKSATFRHIVQGAFSAAGVYVRILKDEFDAVLSVIQSVIGAVQSLIGWLGRIHIPSLPSSIGGIHIPGLSGGLLNNVAGVGGSSQTVVHLSLDGRVFYSAMVNQDKVSKRQTGRSLLA